MESVDKKNAAYVYSVNLLRMLTCIELLSEEEYQRIVAISAKFYNTENIYV